MVNSTAPAADADSEASRRAREIERLAALAATGEDTEAEAAFTELYELLHASLMRWLLSQTHNMAVAEDIAQEAWYKAARSLPTYQERPGGSFTKWLFTIARTCAIDYYRSNRRFGREAPTPDMLLLDREDMGVPAEEVAERRELAALVSTCLAKLTATQRQCLTLRFFSGLSHAETAEVMGKTPENIRVLQYRGLGRLRALMSSAEVSSSLAEYLLSAARPGRKVETIAGKPAPRERENHAGAKP